MTRPPFQQDTSRLAASPGQDEAGQKRVCVLIAKATGILVLVAGLAILFYLRGCHMAQRIASGWCVDCGWLVRKLPQSSP